MRHDCSNEPITGAQLNTRAFKGLRSRLPHPELAQQYTQKIGALRETLNDESIRTEAAELMDRLIESVTIYPDGADGPEAEVVSNVADLAAWATNDSAALRSARGVLHRWLRG
jgi:hypothetical protein